jgi:hypothetical protein
VSRAVTGKCEVEDLGCLIRLLGTSGVTSTIGAAAGTYYFGRQAGTRPSGVGAIVGAVVGAGVGAFALDRLDDAGRNPSDLAMIAVYTVTQGTLTAIGSRLFARRR